MAIAFRDWDHDELTTTFSMSTQVFTDIGMNVTVTTEAATDKVWLFAGVSTSSLAAGNSPFIKFLRNGATDVLLGDAASNRARTLGCGSSANIGDTSQTTAGLIAVDEPGAIGIFTYQLYIRAGASVSAIYVNRGQSDADDTLNARCAVQLVAFVLPVNF